MHSDRIVQSFVNSFNYLVEDADSLLELSKSKAYKRNFFKTKLCRTAIVLYVLSLEGLINRALGYFLPKQFRDFVLEREEKFSFLDKWEMLPILHIGNSPINLDKSKYPWGHLKELFRIRNDFVHPKHDRTVFYRIDSMKQFHSIKVGEIPNDLFFENSAGEKIKVEEKHLLYPMTKLPKDPYTLLPEHVEKIKQVVEDVVNEMDKLLKGKIKKDNWHRSDQMKLIYPPGATFN